MPHVVATVDYCYISASTYVISARACLCYPSTQQQVHLFRYKRVHANGTSVWKTGRHKRSREIDRIGSVKLVKLRSCKSGCTSFLTKHIKGSTKSIGQSEQCLKSCSLLLLPQCHIGHSYCASLQARFTFDLINAVWHSLFSTHGLFLEITWYKFIIPFAFVMTVKIKIFFYLAIVETVHVFVTGSLKQPAQTDLYCVWWWLCVCVFRSRADLEVAGGVDEQVGGLEVTVQHVGRVNVLETSQDLVEEIADVVVAQPLALQQLVQVCLHQSLHDVAGSACRSRRTPG